MNECGMGVFIQLRISFECKSSQPGFICLAMPQSRATWRRSGKLFKCIKLNHPAALWRVPPNILPTAWKPAWEKYTLQYPCKKYLSKIITF